MHAEPCSRQIQCIRSVIGRLRLQPSMWVGRGLSLYWSQSQTYFLILQETRNDNVALKLDRATGWRAAIIAEVANSLTSSMSQIHTIFSFYPILLIQNIFKKMQMPPNFSKYWYQIPYRATFHLVHKICITQQFLFRRKLSQFSKILPKMQHGPPSLTQLF